MDKFLCWVDSAIKIGLELALHNAYGHPFNEIDEAWAGQGYRLCASAAENAVGGEQVEIHLSPNKQSLQVVLTYQERCESHVVGSFSVSEVVNATKLACRVVSGHLEYAEAIEVAKARGYSVSYQEPSGEVAGIYSCSLGVLPRVGPCSSELEAWRQVVERLALVKPGETVWRSSEFGRVTTTNVLLKDGELGAMTRKKRIEVRRLEDHYELFLLERRYLPGEYPRDTRQDRLPVYGHPWQFSSLDEARKAAHMDICDYEGSEMEELNYIAEFLKAEAAAL
ncbi:cyclopropane-fatty-acyl-phospholipid synthase [Novimethylophilus kurashikiensis]|uniref:Cyclopropane-fatty-acyl-phospholipid synthase n=1 Tax=Novimethylophilus kurashikiensis TaxID=1825523 RepID=A0A2R5F8S4_9PROT|nr:hypothetical protein [Novimethylophilus kurashikiensis]GBG14435.1 cyclopropane-fatty-acyl-phospholipid synthase [Novimethylophilus kurashikiensis]